MKKVIVFLIILTGLISCNNDDDNDDVAIVLGDQYVYNEPDCDVFDPIVNGCVATILFVNENEANILPFGDVVYIVPYEINGEVVTILFSDVFVDLDENPRYLIESEDVLVEQDTGNRYIRQ